MRIEIAIQEQQLYCRDDQGQLLAQYAVSTAKNGVGNQNGSGCTPLGEHIIRAKIGDDAPENAVFVGRRQTGEICTPELMAEFPGRDWILTRILWLSGTEIGKNRLGDVDTMRRYVYIHGTPESTDMTIPGSHGCVRMRNADLVQLFELVPIYTPVTIHND